MSVITGQCMCGKIKYKLNGPLGPAICCHCSRCRKAFSGAGSAGARVEGCNFEWTKGADGLSKYYVDESAHGLGFCKDCGTTLVRIHDKKIVGITLGPLNDNPKVKIAAHIFVESKACWDEIGSEAPCYNEWPPKEDMDKFMSNTKES